MKYGFSIPHRGPMSNRQDIIGLAQRGEALGFTYAAVSDHILVPRDIESRYPYSDTGEFPGSRTGESMEQIALMAFVAGVTEQIRILSSIMVIPHRHPLQVAKALATIDQLTDGRVTMGCGTGWMEEEFIAIGAEPFAERGRVTDEYIRVMKQVWRNDDPSYDGDYVKFANVFFRPQPVQKPHPPVWIGGESMPALRRAVALGDAWYPIGANPQFPLDTLARYQARVARLHALAETADRDPVTIELNFSAPWHGVAGAERTDAGERRLFTGTAADIAADVEAMAEVGVGHLFCNFSAPTLAQYAGNLEHWMSEVAPLVGK